MKRSTFILGLTAVTLSPLWAQKRYQEWAGEWTVPSQRSLAYRLISYGEKKCRRGHTLAVLCWCESSLGLRVDHNEDSYGPFGISLATAALYFPKLSASQLIAMLEDNLEEASDLAMKIFEDCYDRAKQLHLTSWRQRMCAGAMMYNRGWNEERWVESYGDKFWRRLTYLMEIT